MDKIFSDIKNTAKSAVKKSGELLELTKLKLAVSDTKSEIQNKLAELGAVIYEAQKQDGEGLEKSDELTQQLEELYEKLEEQESKLSELKKQKSCSSCGNVCEAEADYCSKCGAKFEEE